MGNKGMGNNPYEVGQVYCLETSEEEDPNCFVLVLEKTARGCIALRRSIKNPDSLQIEIKDEQMYVGGGGLSSGTIEQKKLLNNGNEGNHVQGTAYTFVNDKNEENTTTTRKPTEWTDRKLREARCRAWLWMGQGGVVVKMGKSTRVQKAVRESRAKGEGPEKFRF